MNNHEIRGFYETLITTLYGFILAVGLGNFVLTTKATPSHVYSYVLLATAYITIIHFWVVFFTATEDTFTLILAPEHGSASNKMTWFWIELTFTILLAMPMIQMFLFLDDIARFTKALLFVSVLSLLWDAWAFMLNRRVRANSEANAGYFYLNLFRWIGLDLIFTFIMLPLYIIVHHTAHNYVLVVALFLLCIAAGGLILDTVIINPTLYLKRRE